MDNEHSRPSNPEDYISVAQASQEFGLNKSMIRTAIQRGSVHTMSHPWGTRVLRSDIAKLKDERDRLEQTRQGL